MALHNELPVYKATYDLLLEIFKFTKEFGKEYKYNVGENLKHTRAYYWLELFSEFEIEDWAYISKYVKKEELMEWLDMHIKYWEELEEYEKCALVKKIIDRCQESLIP